MVSRRRIVEGLLSAAVQRHLNNPTSFLTTKLQRIRQTLVGGLKEKEQISQAIEHTGRLTIDEIEQSISQKERRFDPSQHSSRLLIQTFKGS